MLGDPAFEDAGAAVLRSVRRQGDELADVAASAVLAFDAAQLLDGFCGLPARGPAGGLDARAAAEAFDLDPGVFAEYPASRLDRPAELGLRMGVLVVRLPLLARILLGVEELELPAG